MELFVLCAMYIKIKNLINCVYLKYTYSNLHLCFFVCHDFLHVFGRNSWQYTNIFKNNFRFFFFFKIFDFLKKITADNVHQISTQIRPGYNARINWPSYVRVLVGVKMFGVTFAPSNKTLPGRMIAEPEDYSHSPD
jgi:hypothetical protein